MVIIWNIIDASLPRQRNDYVIELCRRKPIQALISMAERWTTKASKAQQRSIFQVETVSSLVESVKYILSGFL